MRYWFPLAVAVGLALTTMAVPAAGSIAARIHAAAKAQQQPAEQPGTSPSVAKQEDVSQTARKSTPRVGSRSDRINVADWLNNSPSRSNERVASDGISPPLAPPPRLIAPSQSLRSPNSATPSTPSSDHVTPSPPEYPRAELSEPDASLGEVPAPNDLGSFLNLTGPKSDPKSDTLISPPASPAPKSPKSDTLISPPASPSRDAESQDSEDSVSPRRGDPPLESEPVGNQSSEQSRSDEPATLSPINAAPLELPRQPQEAAANSTRGVESQRGAITEATPEREELFHEENRLQSTLEDEVVTIEQEEDEVTPAKPQKEFSPQMLRLRDRIRICLSHYYQRPENIAQRSPWGVLHALISFGVDTEVQVGRRRQNAIAWLCYNQPCRGMQLLRFDGEYPVPQNGPGYQGHEGQFLSMLALSRVKSTYPMRVSRQELTVQDLVEYEKFTCRPRSELTFKLIGLAHYLPSDATWTSKWGEKWSIPRLLQEELAQPINGACCGGTHRLIGYSMAVKVRKRRQEPIDGQWARAERFVDAYHKYTIKLQNRDGSFSTSWLKKRDNSGDLDRRIQTTGHILEWLIFSLPEEELTDPRIVRSVNYLTASMLNYRNKEWEIGPRGHALRALALYNERVFGDKPGERRALLARRPRK